MSYLQIAIPADDPVLQEILIARLMELGFDGFEEQPANLQAFIPEELFDADILTELLSRWQIGFQVSKLEEKNWNEAWEKDFQPVIVDDFCVIRASFHQPIPGIEHELVITPKMSFGTGHHATTYMMIKAMRALELQGRSVLDFGTGTGVLAILAAQLGADPVLAVDNDSWSVENAQENIAVNNTAHIVVRQMDHIPAEGPFDIILANVNRHVILKELKAMGQQLKPTGVILLSGLLETDTELVEKELLKLNLPISVRLTREGWTCLSCAKNDN